MPGLATPDRRPYTTEKAEVTVTTIIPDQTLPRRTESGMHTRAVNAAAGVLLAAMQQGRQTPTGLAVALDSARLLDSPEHAARVAELEARLAEYERPADEDPIAYTLTEQAPLTVFRAEHNSIVMGLYTTAAEARAHCEAEERRAWARCSAPDIDWIEDEEDGVAELVTLAKDGETESVTDYVVTALEVSASYDEEADQ